MTQSDFVMFTRQDGYSFSVRKRSVMAFMPAADRGTLVWLSMANGHDMQHVRDKVEEVARAVGAVDVAEPAKEQKVAAPRTAKSVKA